MSVNPDGMDSIDYSDFEYQQAYIEHEQFPSSNNALSTANFEIEVLGGIGGLDNNEVAELVYLEVNVEVFHNQSEDDQDVGSETTFKGVVGANLPVSEDLIPFVGTNPQATEISSANTSDVNLVGSVDSEDRVFVPFQVCKQPAFDDQANGPGGAGASTSDTIERPFRNLTGRGPVLDSSDNMSVLSELRQEDEIIPAQGRLVIHMVWDVAETSDAGRAFSVPMDD